MAAVWVWEYLVPVRAVFAFPIAAENWPCGGALLRRAEEGGRPLLLRGITVPQRQELEAALPGRFSFAEDRDNFDYIYSVEAMPPYLGKSSMASGTIATNLRLSTRAGTAGNWDRTPSTTVCSFWRSGTASVRAAVRRKTTLSARAFRCWESLELEGTVLYAGGQAVAFTVSERLTGDTMDVHFEKARAGINGAYPMIAREYARQTLQRHPEVRYLNREEDMGLENLRKAKQDWYPLFMVEKLTLLEAGGHEILIVPPSPGDDRPTALWRW